MTAQAVGFPLLVLPDSAVMAWTDQQVIYSGDLVHLTDRDPQINERREALVDWLERHGIDARHVPTPGWIVRDETNRCVVYWGGDDHCDDCNLLTRRAIRVMQLEAPPLPFPMPWKGESWVAQYETRRP